MSTSIRASRPWGWVCLTMLAALACGGERESAPGADVEVSRPAAEPQVPAADDRLSGKLELPADLPGDVPLYPGASLTWANSDEAGLLVSFSTADDVAAVAEYLQKQFAAQGWLTDASDHDAGKTLLAVKGTREATVIVTGEDETTNIDVILMPRG
jgi:hypothetical protein